MKDFETTILPHLRAAYNLARWLTKDDSLAEDMVQEATLHALEAFSDLRTSNSKAWYLSIVRNTCYSFFREKKKMMLVDFSQEELAAPEENSNPQKILIDQWDQAKLKKCLEELPEEFRELIVLHEWEELSYKEMAQITNLPVGTVMSRLSRARQKLHQLMVDAHEVEGERQTRGVKK